MSKQNAENFRLHITCINQNNRKLIQIGIRISYHVSIYYDKFQYFLNKLLIILERIVDGRYFNSICPYLLFSNLSIIKYFIKQNEPS